MILLPCSLQNSFFLFTQVGEFLDPGFIQPVDDGVLALGDENAFDLMEKERVSCEGAQKRMRKAPFSDL